MKGSLAKVLETGTLRVVRLLCFSTKSWLSVTSIYIKPIFTTSYSIIHFDNHKQGFEKHST